MSASVSIISCRDYEDAAVEAAFGRLLAPLGGMGRFVKPGESVLIKPNLLATKPRDKAVNTDPSVIRVIVKRVLDAGGRPFIGDSPGIGTARKNADRCGIGAVADALGVPIVEFATSLSIGKTRQDGFPLEVAEEARIADAVINVAKLKTHGQVLMTLGVKNMFGCVVGRRKVQWHLKAGVKRDAFARMLVQIYEALNPRLTVMDGIVGMEGNGPGSGVPRPFGILGASPDAVALDTVIMSLMGLVPSRLPTLRAAAELGVGETRLDRIALLGEDPETLRIGDLRLPESADLEWIRPDFLLGPLKRSLTAYPEPERTQCNLCRVCVEACPEQVIDVAADRLNIDTRNCIRCFCCQELCPQGAMKTRQGWLLKRLQGR